ncbi:hypothetical protein BJ165DRAFT_1580826, partial [Panaeolus papilionaceus]
IDEFVKTKEFDECCLQERRVQDAACDVNLNLQASDDSEEEEYIESDVGKFEARYYYAGVGRKWNWPTLIYRTSDDKYETANGVLKDALVVSETHEFAQEGVWDRIRNKVVELLDMRNICFTSVDFVHFRSRSKDYPEVLSNPTIWIGVMACHINTACARESASDIRAYLDELKVQNIDIAYRKSVAKFLSSHGPPLFQPVEDDDSLALRSVIDKLSATLSIPITAQRNSTQGTLGPYFQAGDKVYAITTRHNLFPLNEGNAEYRHSDSAPKRHVFVMGNRMFRAHLQSIRNRIVNCIHGARYDQRYVDRYKNKVKTGVDLPKSQLALEEAEATLVKSHAHLNRVKECYADIVKNWSSRENRTIGFVIWSPPLGVGAAPHQYTRDLCVVELYKEKFKNLIGNTFWAGLEDAFPSNRKSQYLSVPVRVLNGLVGLRGILTTDQLNDPTSTERFRFDFTPQSEHPPRRVVKRGAKTNTTVGTLSRYMSHVRKYSMLGGHMDSLELPIMNFDNWSRNGNSGDGDPFCEEGDSGSVVFTPKGEFVGLLNGGTSMGFSACDIGYATPFEWVWEQVLKEFPGAELDFDNPQFKSALPLSVCWTAEDLKEMSLSRDQ